VKYVPWLIRSSVLQRNISRVFDLKGSSRARYVELLNKVDTFDNAIIKRRKQRKQGNVVSSESSGQVLLDDNLMELTEGKPFPLKHRAKIFFQKAVMNDTLFLSIINVVDYSILVGFDEDKHEIVVGIIDYLRQYDIVKKMERMGKSVGMLTGQAEPTIIQPPQYKKRFSLAMERYFMTVPDKWIAHDV
jgi:1-phosphatidylinositol-3-phosphate 5-kinase